MDNLTPEEQQQLLDLGSLNEEDRARLELVLAQMKMGGQGGPTSLQSRQVGNTVVPPHWLELIGGLAQQGAAKNKQAAQQKQADTLMEQQRIRQQQQQALMLKAIQGQQQPQQWPDATEGMGMMNKSPIRFGG